MPNIVYVKDGTTWRVPYRGIYVNDNGTWRTINTVEVNDNGNWRLVHAINMQDQTITDAGVEASFGLTRAGGVSGQGTGHPTGALWYHGPTDATIGDGYYVRWTHMGGAVADSLNGGAYNVFQSLSSTRIISQFTAATTTNLWAIAADAGGFDLICMFTVTQIGV
jgi:hypothetical protein